MLYIKNELTHTITQIRMDLGSFADFSIVKNINEKTKKFIQSYYLFVHVSRLLISSSAKKIHKC